MKNYLVFITILVIGISICYAGDFELSKNSRFGLEIKWKLDSYKINQGEKYSSIEFPGGCGLYAVGKPNIPSQQTFIEIPTDAKIRLQLSDVKIEQVKLEKPIAPAQEPFIDTIGAEKILARKFYYDDKCYSSNAPFPGKVVEVAYQGIMRGRKLVLLKVNPVQYFPKSGNVVIHTSMKISVVFEGSQKNITTADDAMDPIAKALVLNYQEGQKRQGKNVDYLIVTVADLEEQAKTFANWKAGQGLTPKVEVVGNNPAPETVRDIIKSYYPAVKYVLIMADHNLIPLTTSSARHPLGDERCQQLGLEDSSIPSDLYYSCLDGSDYYPDVYLGRIPAGNKDEATLLINKIMNYKDNPPQGEWRKRFLLCGEFQYQYRETNVAERLFCETAFTIWNSLHTKFVFPSKTVGTGSSGLGHKEYFFRKSANSDDPTKPGTYRSKIRDDNKPVVNCQMPQEWAKNIVSDTEAKENALAFWNKGAFLVQHRDHGSKTGWGKPSVGKNDVANLDNGDKLPVLFSINCLTGAMDYSSDCFVEAALKNPNGGAVVALGSTRVSYSWWNDRLCDGFYTCLFGTDVFDCMDTGVNLSTGHPFSRKLGIVLNFGKMYLAKNYPSNPWGTSYDYTETEFYLFHCIGDPHLDIMIKD